MRKHVRRALLGLTTAALVSSGALVAPAQAANAQADSSADWLASQLNEQRLLVSSWTDGSQWYTYTDHGLTLDVFFALEGLDTRSGLRSRILRAVEGEVDAYLGSGGTTYAGATGKLLTAVQTQGLDAGTYAGGGLLDRLEGLVVAEGAEEGRAEDSSEWGDTSNTIGQSWVVRALASSGSDLVDETTAFLLKQQCADGFFRVYMDSPDHTCDGGAADESGASVDATAFGVQALLVASTAGVEGLADDIAEGVDWLVGQQRNNGSFREDGTANANSTGVAAETLAAAGHLGAAGTAATWLLKHQIKGTQAKRKLSGEKGAVAFDAAALERGLSKGITRAERYQWRRATAQAAVGIDALLPSEKVTVKAPKRAGKRTKVRVRGLGLEAGERYTVRRGAKKVRAGWVRPDGRVVVRVTMPRKKQNVTLRVIGSRGNRSGATVVKVR